MGKYKPLCLDCKYQIDDEPYWCDICPGFICIDCDPLHDCDGQLQHESEEDQDPAEIEEQWRELFSNSKKKPSNYN